MTLSWTLGYSLLAMAAAGSLRVRSLYSTTDCSGTPYEEQKFVQDVCTEWVLYYVRYTDIPATALLRFRTGIQMQLAQLTVISALLPMLMLVCARIL